MDDISSAFLGIVILLAGVITPIVLWKRKKKITAVVLVLVCALLFLAITLPSCIQVHTAAYRAICINNLLLIEKAKRQWAEVNHKSSMDVPTEEDLGGTNNFLPHKIICPGNGKYTIGPVNQKPTCNLAEQGHTLE